MHKNSWFITNRSTSEWVGICNQKICLLDPSRNVELLSIFCLCFCICSPYQILQRTKSFIASVQKHIFYDCRFPKFQYFISGKFPSFFFFFLFYFPLPPENFLGFSEETKGTKHSLKTSKHILNKFGNKANYCFICEQQTGINNCGLQAYIKIAAAFLRTYLKARNCWKGTVIILLNWYIGSSHWSLDWWFGWSYASNWFDSFHIHTQSHSKMYPAGVFHCTS